MARRVVLAGASGLVGREILRGLVADPSVAAIHVLGRREVEALPKANLAVAKAALSAGARRAGLVSAMGANAKSRIFYSRVKGELEDALTALPFESLVIARPSMLAGDRKSLGQPDRSGERIALAVGRLLGPLVPKNYRSVAAADVAKSLLTRVPVGRGREVVASGDMH